MIDGYTVDEVNETEKTFTAKEELKYAINRLNWYYAEIGRMEVRKQDIIGYIHRTDKEIEELREKVESEEK